VGEKRVKLGRNRRLEIEAVTEKGEEDSGDEGVVGEKRVKLGSNRGLRRK